VEFQYAVKFMPQVSQPNNNLGLVFEATGKLEDAGRSYEKALEINPQDVQATGNLARVYVRLNRKDARTRELLHAVVQRDSRPDWVEWARIQLAMFKPAPTTQE
jgi:Flp pilus assembly protein TadD